VSRRVHVDLGERGYEILIGAGLPVGAAAGVRGRALVVSDSNVAPLYGAECAGRLRQNGLEPRSVTVPAGEASKSLETLARLFEEAVRSGLDRRSVVVALGGGMVGDLAGFLAATFLRGVRVIQVPTSLLAMVDSSVGGKTGVNLPQGKNLVGAFHQPAEVVAEVPWLSTLPDGEYRSGLAEVVKYGMIWDAALFRRLEEAGERLLGREAALLEDVIARCCEIKAEVVAMDEREGGVRSVLNFGHTLGHALETAAGYGQLRHGEAVALGMVYAAELSKTVRGFSEEEGQRLTALLRRLGLPADLRESGVALPWQKVREIMRADKKAGEGVPRFVLAERIGSVVFGCEVGEESLRAAFDQVAGARVGEGGARGLGK